MSENYQICVSKLCQIAWNIIFCDQIWNWNSKQAIWHLYNQKHPNLRELSFQLSNPYDSLVRQINYLSIYKFALLGNFKVYVGSILYSKYSFLKTIGSLLWVVIPFILSAQKCRFWLEYAGSSTFIAVSKREQANQCVVNFW